MEKNDLAQQLEYFTSNWVNSTQEAFKEHPLAQLFRNEVEANVKSIVHSFDSTYLVKASVGSGNWANIPWVSILNPKITTTTQDGIYPVYLFKADGSGFYLSLNQGTTIPTHKYGKTKAESRAETIKGYILEQLPELMNWGKPEIDLLASTDLGKSYETYNIVAKYYDASSKLNNEQLKNDLLELLHIYRRLETHYKIISEKEIKQEASSLHAEKQDNERYPKKLKVSDLTTLSKPFLLLAGISGTGKTRFVREQAKVTGSLSETYCLTSVRPDWHEPSDLLGYISRLGGQAEYITTDVLQFIAKAWRAIIDANLVIQTDTNGRLQVTGEKPDLENILPYWLCLDEMNLAPVEQYFADYLSILETREWRWSDENQFSYSCDAILKPSVFTQVADKSQFRTELGLSGSQYDQAWDLFCNYGMSLPFNLIVAGTVNMDETTHGFSRKVIDRALSFDFGDFFPNDFDYFFEPVVNHKALSYPLYSQAEQRYLPTVDSDGQKSIAFLKSINAILDNTPFKLAFRALNELLLSVINSRPNNDIELQAVWDDFLMCKVLPRIDGDHDKLIFINGNSSDDTSSPSYSTTEQTILNELSKVLAEKLDLIWVGSADKKPVRPDLYRQNIDGSPLDIDCRSKDKLEWMQLRLQRSGFTSFWP
ncbi:MrcB family domain-containing protein [Psychrobacter phenylpyruvicus]|uniref:Domain of uncharacterized function (DUF3578) n=1 Tax=Psychrobacter phenylpyruvicus TaxID=29432 RepID=A0A379LIX5_9GAMM|nr:DUF3578 domain-containing protein [Psychrobacter phenylpyruvicus]SUD90045.1 Domain of uncharacterised function (DUF3578) [Psychrobacter phenylpyruvicus]